MVLWIIKSSLKKDAIHVSFWRIIAHTNYTLRVAHMITSDYQLCEATHTELNTTTLEIYFEHTYLHHLPDSNYAQWIFDKAISQF
jgi:hypothetical protein